MSLSVMFWTIVMGAAAVAAWGIWSHRRRTPRYPRCGTVMVDVPRKWSRPVEIPSFTDPEVVYVVNPHRMTCTCEEFQRRRHAKWGSIDRMCDHIARALVQIGAVKHGLLTCILLNRSPRRCYHSVGRHLVFAFEPGDRWIDIYTYDDSEDGHRMGRFQRYGYHLDDQRWSRRKRPPNRDEVLRQIRRLFR